jgi:hypothetical protein
MLLETTNKIINFLNTTHYKKSTIDKIDIGIIFGWRPNQFIHIEISIDDDLFIFCILGLNLSICVHNKRNEEIAEKIYNEFIE